MIIYSGHLWDWSWSRLADGVFGFTLYNVLGMVKPSKVFTDENNSLTKDASIKVYNTGGTFFEWRSWQN
jgi:hypothetical protein